MTAQMLILTGVFATAALAGQATTTPQPSSSVPDDRLAAVPAPAPMIVEGCVATAREVNGGPSNLAERLGLNEGFILTSARVIKGRVPAPAVTAAKAPRMFVLKGLSDEQLKPHLGRRVRIEGSAVPGGVAETGKEEPLATLTVAAVRQVRGECAMPKPSD